MINLHKQKRTIKRTHCKKSVTKDFLYSLFLVIIVAGVWFLLPSPDKTDNFDEFSWEMLDE